MPERLLVVLPTYNESRNLDQIVPAILSQDHRIEVLVVDDNSPDGTGAIADALAETLDRVHVLHRPGKEGLGRAYIAGFRWGLERGFDLLFEMDADFSHDPRFLPDLI
ncbi:MAG TPA: glycosyltransferase, partial [Gemmatimonadales bacterium]|nr:glycosyltransferase [Gemmatimonadales bacterium]